MKYGQTEARSMLGRINELRTGEDAWCWNSSDTEKVKVSGLKELVYDYELEKAGTAELSAAFADQSVIKRLTDLVQYI